MLNVRREITHFDFIEMLKEEGRLKRAWVNESKLYVMLEEKDEEGNYLTYNLNDWEDESKIERRLYINNKNEIKFI